ncbi:MAG TPA: hypothetical protein VHX44_20175 [Planctomycetota bacterium]|jgi:hypothetical protein|nr:hypothetical protein [Planctomycetota bacterium]
MLSATDLTADGKLLADHLDAATADGVATALPGASGAHLAALALIAGERGAQDVVAPLLTLLERDGIAGKAIAWALGRLASASNGVEAKAVAALADGGLDVRENAYATLAGLAARGVASKGLGDIMVARVQAEIDRAKSGGSGLGEQACRVLAVLGEPRTPDLIQQVIDQDRFCDRFELQRLRKSVQDDGRDQETIKAMKAPWRTTFADALFVPKAPAPAPAPTPAKNIEKTAVKPPAPAAKAPAPAAVTTPADGEELPADDGVDEVSPGEGDEDALPGDPQPIDWKTFATSPEIETLPAPLKQLAGQLGPLLEQLSVRAIRAPLADLAAQEFAGLLLQVLPQALPPQHVQMALSPHAMQCYKAMAKFLIRTGVATKGNDLLDAVSLVRKELTNQIRQAGILNGPDYSDPDDKPPVAPKA